MWILRLAPRQIHLYIYKEDGPRVLGETYQDAARRFVDLGFLRKIDEPHAIALAYTAAELSAIAKKNAINSTRATKEALSEKLFRALGVAPFAARLELKIYYPNVGSPLYAFETTW
jgi:hypothetical protein